MSAATPGMAAAEASSGEQTASQRTVQLQCLKRVGGAGGREAAPASRAEQHGKGGRNRPAIGSHQQNQDGPERIHFWDAVGFINFASVFIKSLSTSASFLPTMDARATSTRSSGWTNSN